MKIIRLILFIVISVFFLRSVFASAQKAPPDSPAELIFFYSPACNHCADARRNIIPLIEARFKGRIVIDYRDISDVENYKMLVSLQEKYGKSANNLLPVFFFGGNIISGEKEVNEKLIGIIGSSLNSPFGKEEGAFSVDLKKRFLSFTPLAITGAALIDGVNPCAFTVVVFFISFLALQGYRKLDMAITGSFFILTVFLTYLLIGIGLFDGLYRISGFWAVARIINYFLGTLSLVLGALCVYDLIRLSKSGDPRGMILQLPKSVKERIHSLIRFHYRNPGRSEGKKPKLRVFQLILTAVITGFLVSLLEAVCTGQLYLPTIAFILKTSDLKMKALIYLLLYNVMFVVPLAAVFILALMGLTAENFSGFMRKYMAWIKFFMAVIFFSLGWLLIWRL